MGTQLQRLGRRLRDDAKQHSPDGSCRRGGDLGTFSRGQMVEECDTTCFEGEVGVVQGPVKTQFGYHLLEVTKRA